VGLTMGTFLNLVGAWLRYVSVYGANFWVCFTGQFLCAVAQLFILSVPTLLVALWFGVNERASVTSVAVTANQFGCAIGFLIPPLFVPSSTASQSSLKDGLGNLLLYQALLSSAVTIGLVLFGQTKPPSPPSLTSSAPRHSWRESLQVMIKSRSFMFLLFGFSFQLGALWAFSTVLGAILDPYGYSSSTIGWVGCANMLVGVIGGLIAGYIMDWTKYYRTVTVVCYLGTALCLLWFVVEIDTEAMIFLSYSMMGFFCHRRNSLLTKLSC